LFPDRVPDPATLSNKELAKKVNDFLKATGSTNGPPQLAKMLKALLPGDVVVVTKLDRVARSARDLLNIVGELKDRDCGFISLGDSWCDTTNEMGRFMLTVMSGIAELERDLIRKRCQAGIERRGQKARNSAGHQPSTRVKGARLPSVTRQARQWLSWPASTSAATQRSGGHCILALSRKASFRKATIESASGEATGVATGRKSYR